MSIENEFIDWFKNNQGVFYDNLSEIKSIIGMGRSLVAKSDIANDTTLFKIPRKLCLSTKNSNFKQEIGADVYNELKNDNESSWTPLIINLCYEYLKYDKSLWYPYFNILPKSLTSLIYWDDNELQLLNGSSVLDKIGKSDIISEFTDRVKPIIENNQEIFKNHDQYTVDLFIWMGSLILSRSFNVYDWNPNKNNDESEDEEDDGDNEVSQSVDDVSMIPMADILNAKSDQSNAHLVYEKDYLSMVTTSDIKAGDQIYNTYANPPNADLLRRYGHVDYTPLAIDHQYMGNKYDVVELPADIILNEALPNASEDEKERRVEFLLDECGEDVFELNYDDSIPDLMKICSVLFTIPFVEFKKYEKSRKLPKLSSFNDDCKNILIKSLNVRLSQYVNSIDDDYKLLKDNEENKQLTFNEFNALVVILGEKRILWKSLKDLENYEHKKKKQKVN